MSNQSANGRNRTDALMDEAFHRLLERLACVVDTLVIFMGVSGAPQIAKRLMAHRCGGETPAAVIRWGTYEHQKCHGAAITELADLIGARAIIVIGADNDKWRI